MRLEDDNELFIWFVSPKAFDQGINLGGMVRVVFNNRKLRILIKDGLTTRHARETCQRIAF